MTGIYDVIVVGAGSVGNPAALFLAEAGLRVLAIDKFGAPGQGQNKAAIGGVRATHSDPAKIMTAIESLRIMSTWKETYGSSIGWKTGGYCFPTYDEGLETTLKGYFPVQRAHGLDIDWLDADGIAEVVPGVNRQGLRGGTYSPGDGQVSPLMFAAAVFDEAIARGAEYRFGEAVVEYLREGERVIGVRTDKGTYHASHVVVTTGADSARDGELLGIDLPVTPDSHEAGISAPIEPFLPPLVVDMRPGPEGKTANFYFGQNHEGQIIFCYTPREIFVGKERENISEFMPILASRLVSLIPKLADLLIRRTWRGLYPMTPDGVPIVDLVQSRPGLVLGVGMCGQGFMLGPGVAKSITSFITEGCSALPPKVQATFRFERDFYAASEEALK